MIGKLCSKSLNHRSLNRGCSQPAVRDIFAAISKLGDGTFWYGLILLLPVVYGETAIYPRVVLGLHYPSDVAAGALLGAALAALSRVLMP